MRRADGRPARLEAARDGAAGIANLRGEAVPYLRLGRLFEAGPARQPAAGKPGGHRATSASGPAWWSTGRSARHQVVIKALPHVRRTGPRHLRHHHPRRRLGGPHPRRRPAAARSSGAGRSGRRLSRWRCCRRPDEIVPHLRGAGRGIRHPHLPGARESRRRCAPRGAGDHRQPVRIDQPARHGGAAARPAESGPRRLVDPALIVFVETGGEENWSVCWCRGWSG